MPGMSFIRKYQMAFEMAGSPLQQSSAEIEMPLGVFTVAPVHQYAPVRVVLLIARSWEVSGTISWDPML